MIRAVIFDIGGVIERNPRTGWRRRWAATAGCSQTELERRLGPIWRRGSLGEWDLAEIERATAATLGLEDSQLRAMMDDVWTEYVGTLDAELTGYFASLRPRFRTALLSNSFVGAREREQAAHGLERLCDVIVYSHEVGLMKPDPAIYRIACERLGVAPQESAFADDVAENVTAAAALGMQAVLVENAEQAIGALERILNRAG